MMRPSTAWIAALLAGVALGGCPKRQTVPVTELAASGDAEEGSEPPEFVFGPGDEIEISVWRHEDLDMKVKIGPDGAISYPLVGRIVIEGMTYPELMDTLSREIATYYVDPQVSVNILEVSSMKVHVLGEVRNPTSIPIESELDVVEALTRAGWISDDSRTDNILLVRVDDGRSEMYTIDLRDLLSKGDTRQNVLLAKGDIIYVPKKTIANVEQFFRRISGILSPFVSGTVIYRNITTGNPVGASGALD